MEKVKPGDLITSGLLNNIAIEIENLQQNTVKFDKSRNVGIGTLSPQARLQVDASDDTACLNLRNVDNGGIWKFRLAGDGRTPNNLHLDYCDILDMLMVSSNGEVGIGTTRPGGRLTIKGGVQPAQGTLEFFPSDTDVAYDGGSDKRFIFTARNGAKTSFMGGNVGIGTTEPRTTLEVEGYITYNGEVLKGSSREIKENIDPFSILEAFDALDKLDPVKFNLKSDKGKKSHIGFIAEDVPDLVSTTDKKAIINDYIVAILTKVVKEQQKMIAALTAKVNALEINDI